jgi:hypothetical protein
VRYEGVFEFSGVWRGCWAMDFAGDGKKVFGEDVWKVIKRGLRDRLKGEALYGG